MTVSRDIRKKEVFNMYCRMEDPPQGIVYIQKSKVVRDAPQQDAVMASSSKCNNIEKRGLLPLMVCPNDVPPNTSFFPKTSDARYREKTFYASALACHRSFIMPMDG